ncbi:MAG: LLM class flavin-dependent oxidoreductase, partial [Dehalococcoidia bacterium]
PHPPIWVGGNSRVAMRRAAQHGDGWHPLRMTPEQLRDGIAELRAMERRYNRTEPLTVSLQGDYIRITDAPLGEDRLPLNGTPAQIAADLRAYAEAGLDSMVLRFIMARDMQEFVHWMERFAHEVRPALHA